VDSLPCEHDRCRTSQEDSTLGLVAGMDPGVLASERVEMFPGVGLLALSHRVVVLPAKERRIG
jgi:hypothetical protein